MIGMSAHWPQGAFTPDKHTKVSTFEKPPFSGTKPPKKYGYSQENQLLYKIIMAKRAPRTRNGGTWTESQYESAIRSALRSKFRYWKPAMDCKKHHSRPYQGKDKRRKTETQCQSCMEWFPPSNVQMDHIVPCGSIKGKSGRMTGNSLAAFLKRLTPEDMFCYQPLCKPCHKAKTKKERTK
jgi:hypothetical protein